jgi:hypothetical protein
MDGYVSIAIWIEVAIRRITTEQTIQPYECTVCGDRYWAYGGDNDADATLWRDRHNAGKHSRVFNAAQMGNPMLKGGASND